MKNVLTVIIAVLTTSVYPQNYGNFPKIEKEKLLRDLDMLYQGLDKFHSGMYWYTGKDSVDVAFTKARTAIDHDLNVLEFHKIIAPLVGLSREDHTDIYLPQSVDDRINKDQAIRLLPLSVVFLGERLYCVQNLSDNPEQMETLEIEFINGRSPKEIVNDIGSLFASDGYIKAVKFNDLSNFSFSKYYYYYYGVSNSFEIKFKEIPNLIVIEPLPVSMINENLQKTRKHNQVVVPAEPLTFKLMDSETAYLGVHSFNNSEIKRSAAKSLKRFLQNSFKQISEKGIKNVIVDISENGGGTEGNEGLLYSYFGKNYQKYRKVRAKTQKATLDNRNDKPIVLRTFGFWERIFSNKKMRDGSLERRHNAGYGLMAFTQVPEHKFEGNVYILIGPTTYSGGSEFANMMYSNGIGTFIGQETGGGYFGNTSGYTRELTLPNSKITVDIPALQFIMNVEPKLPFGRGVIPHYKVIPTIEQYINEQNPALEQALKLIQQ